MTRVKCQSQLQQRTFWLFFFFYHFPKKCLDISCQLSAKHTIHMKFKTYFLWKTNTKYELSQDSKALLKCALPLLFQSLWPWDVTLISRSPTWVGLVQHETADQYLTSGPVWTSYNHSFRKYSFLKTLTQYNLRHKISVTLISRSVRGIGWCYIIFFE